MSGSFALGFIGQLTFRVGLLALVLPALAAKGAKPEFGPNVLIFDPSMPSRGYPEADRCNICVAGAQRV